MMVSRPDGFDELDERHVVNSVVWELLNSSSGLLAVTPILMADALQYVFGPLLFVIAVFLILLVLVQRGRGGGLAGAFGGMGGQSAFGAKAGDAFTRVTIIAATVWILLCMASIKFLQPPEGPFGEAADTMELSADPNAKSQPAASEKPAVPEKPAASDPSGATNTPETPAETPAPAEPGADQQPKTADQ